MSHIKLERIIWPVGHGAFYTEQFRDENNKVVFTAVYDCGSEQHKMRGECIEAIFPKDEKNVPIDALFLSHFHADHVNGLMELLQRTTVNKLYIPQLTDDYMLQTLGSLMSSPRNAGNANTLDFLSRIYLDSRIGGVESIYEVPTLNPEFAGREEFPQEEQGQEIQARNHRVADPILYLINELSEWVYIPCNLYANKKELIDAFKADGSYITDEKIDFAKIFADFKRGRWKKMQDIYAEAFNSHNEYSMTVFSGLKKDANYICDIDIRYARPCSIQPWLEWDPNCIYTGDFEPANGNIQALKAFYSIHENAWNRTFLLQVPHHGSKNNYDDELYDTARVVFISAAVHDKYRHPSMSTIHNILKRGCYPIIVRDDKNEILDLNYYIERN